MRKSRLWLLFAAHIICGIAFCAWVAIERRIPFVLEEILSVPHLAFVFSQASLLAIWAVFSKQKSWQRLAGWIVGSIYLDILLSIGLSLNAVIFLATGTSSVAALTLLTLRWWRFDLYPLDTHMIAARPPTLQFTIRALLSLTVAAAFVTFAIKTTWHMFSSAWLLLFMGSVSVSFAAAGIAAAFAALARTHTLAKSLASICFAAILGAMLVLSIDPNDWQICFYFYATMLLQSALVLGSLLIVRLCSYRLASRYGAIPQRAIQLNGHHSNLH